MGDSSDNYKGVKGIGDKGARNLVTKYQTIENIYQNIDEISGKTKLALENSKMQAFMGKELATIIVNLDLGLTLDDVKLVDPDFDTLASIYKNYKLNTFLKKLETNGCVNGTNDDETDELKGMLSIDVSRDVGSLEATLKKADVAMIPITLISPKFMRHILMSMEIFGCLMIWLKFIECLIL